MVENRVKSLTSWNIQLENDYRGENGVVKPNERETTTGHKKGSLGSKKLILSIILAVLIPVCFPLVHILLFSLLWGHLSHEVDPKGCSCSCWDTVFKGKSQIW